MSAEEEELARQVEEAIRRSLEQTKLSEDEIFEAAVAASLKSQDEEVARRMQQEQYDKFEEEVRKSSTSEPTTPGEYGTASGAHAACDGPSSHAESPTPVEWATVAGAERYRDRSGTPGPWITVSGPPRKSDQDHAASKAQVIENGGPTRGFPPLDSVDVNQGTQPAGSDRTGLQSELRDVNPDRSSVPPSSQHDRSGKTPSRSYDTHLEDSPSSSGDHNTPSSPYSPYSPQSPQSHPETQQIPLRHSPRKFSDDSPRRRARPGPSTNSPVRNNPPAPGPRPARPPRNISPKEEEMLPPKVVIDGQNVGCEFGGDRYGFRARGIELALDFYQENGIPAIAMLPRRKVDTRNKANPHLADDPELLLRLADEGRLFFTPAGVHDDNFILNYAMKHEADVISNDLFRKELDMQATVDAARQLRTFLDAHLVPYTFVVGEFIPNPNPNHLGLSMHQSRPARR